MDENKKIKNPGSKFEKKLHGILERFYNHKLEIIILGLALILSPFISIIISAISLGKINIYGTGGEVSKFSTILISIGIWIFFSGIALYGFNLKNYRWFFIKIFALLCSLLFVFAYYPKIRIISFTIVVFFIFEGLFKIVSILIDYWNRLESSTQISIILPIISAVILYYFKTEIKF